MRIIASILICLTTTGLNGADWFVSKGASGSANGTSLANAWDDLGDVVWGASGVQAGDTLWINGSATSYADEFIIGASGTPENPITIAHAALNGGNTLKATLQGFIVAGRTNIIVDGSISSSFVPVSSVPDIFANTNNIGFRTTDTDGPGVYLTAGGGAGNQFRWIEMGPHGTTNNVGAVHAVQILSITSLTNLVFEYNYIHHAQDDGINLSGTPPTANYFDGITVRWNIIYKTGDDGIQWTANSLTLANNWIRDHWSPLYNGHPDQLQLSGGAAKGYYKIVNNMMGDKANSIIIGEHYIEEGGTIGPMYILGNLFHNTRDWVFEGTQAYGVSFMAWRPNADVSVEAGTFDGFHYAHNTMYYQYTYPFEMGRVAPDGSTKSVWDLTVTNAALRNNLFIDSKYNSSEPAVIGIPGDGDPGTSTNGVHYLDTSFPFTHNIVAGSNKSATWDGTSNTDIASFGNGNSSTLPSVMSTNLYDFRILSADTTAKGAGYDTSALTNTVPEYMLDLWGNARTFTDIGAHSPSSDYTVLKIGFEDSDPDGTDTYQSDTIYNTHGYHFGYVDDQEASNRFPDQISWTNPVTGILETGASFQRTNDGWGIYGFSGDYVAVTNIAPMQSLSQATVMLWAWYGAHGDLSTDWTSEGSRRLITGGYAYSGGWSGGLHGNHGTEWRFYTNNNDAFSDIYVQGGPAFEIETSPGPNTGASDGPHHYGFTWDEGVVVSYRDGLPISTNTQCADAGVTQLTIRGPSGGLTTGFLMIGGDNHNGLPNLTPHDDAGDQYPNHAFHRGMIDEVLIASVAYSTNEFWNAYNGVSASSAGGGEGGGGASPTVHVGRHRPGQTMMLLP